MIAALVLSAAATAVWVGQRLLAKRRPGESPRPLGEPVLRVMQQAYPGWGRDELELLMRETWLRPYAFEPFTQFKERPFRGRYVNVDEVGFRWSRGQCAWPPDPSRGDVFLCGGSTLFGYGVTDADTIPSQLRPLLASSGRSGAPCVYNFGRGWYYSSQERALFERLLVSGARPARAVFVDGLNDFFFPADEPRFTLQLERFVTEINAHLESGAPRTPRRSPSPPASLTPGVSEEGPAGRPVSDPRAVAAGVVDRYLRHSRLTRAIGDAFGVRTTFVWQAVPVYGYDPSRHPFQESLTGSNRFSSMRAGYEAMAERRRRDPSLDIVWCAEIQAGEGLLYLDSVHYSPAMCRRMAECIAAGLR